MKPQTQLLLLLAYIAAALVMSRGVLAGAGTHAAMPATVQAPLEAGTMKPQTQLLLLLAYIAAALVMSRGVLAGAGTHAAMPVRTVEDDEAGFTEREEEAAYPQRRMEYLLGF
ncbi:hypothetical protein TRIUR3_17839 [Triticum urartu]|uniref:Uncharacterized protein n=1 Tax=Triticum urartu TaxID=4572 RepID=M8AFG7_TRIUA|nr:hypothetical protein TRIUR3_17839 [Triticum urartu]